MMQQELPLLVVATRNAHKTGEIRAMLAGKWEVRDLSDYPQAPPVEETGVTFTENATLKAVSASKCIPRHCPGGRFRAGGGCSGWPSGRLVLFLWGRGRQS